MFKMFVLHKQIIFIFIVSVLKKGAIASGYENIVYCYITPLTQSIICNFWFKDVYPFLKKDLKYSANLDNFVKTDNNLFVLLPC